MLDKELFEYKNYGRVHIKLDQLMTEKEITTYKLSSKANIRFQTIQSLRKESTSRIDLEVLAKICYMLDCKIQDIIEYLPSK